MKTWKTILTATGISLAMGCTANAVNVVDDSSLGLSKTSVFDTPTPIVPSSTAGMPGQNTTAPAYFTGAPPWIPHQIQAFVPIKASQNMCLGCHLRPNQIGQKQPKGVPTPIPQSHYTDLRRAPDTVTKGLIGARYNCTQCHVPQNDAPPLVVNTYMKP